jgi:spore maturation protein CgeB
LKPRCASPKIKVRGADRAARTGSASIGDGRANEYGLSMTASLPPNLAANLKALSARNPELAERICLPVQGDHVELPADGPPMYRIHRSWRPFALVGEPLEASLASAPPDGDVLLFGVGLGEQLDRLLGRAAGRVVAWDRDPWMLRLLLTARDWSRSIRKGQLQLRLGSDLLDELAAGRPVVLHPFFAERYEAERRLLDEGLGARRALVCAGTLFVEEIADALRADGFSVGVWEPARLASEELALAARRWTPELVVSVNHVHGLAEACRQLDLPLVVWEIDPATDALRPTTAGDSAFVFTWRRAQVAEWKAAGFGQTWHLPLAADTGRRHPVEVDERYVSPIAFVGSSMVEQGRLFRERILADWVLWQGGSPTDAIAEGSERLERVLDRHRDDYSNCRVEELALEEMGDFVRARRARGRDPVALIAEMVGADKRIAWVANLGQVGATVWGDEGWEFVQQYGVRWKGPAGHRDELNRVYCGAGINLDIGRIYQSDIITMRVFDVMACGGFVLAEHSDHLDELFTPGVELDSYRSLEELLGKVEHYLEHPDEARAIAARGLEAVRSKHTIDGRVRHMLGVAGIVAR